MKRGTKATIFIATMALTIGSLMAIVGPRRYWHHGAYGHGYCAGQNHPAHQGAGWAHCADSVKK
jgi:hypothetical protein